jgi:hypothetical protein
LPSLDARQLVLTLMGTMDLPSRRALPVWLPFAVLGVAAVYLGLRWDEIPPTWTTHWDIAGRPNGWSHHDPAGVFGPLIIGALILTFMEGIGRVTRLRRSTEAYALEAVRDATLSFVRTMALGLSLVFALLAVDLPLGPRVPHALLGALLLGVVMGALALGTVRMAAALAAARAVPDTEPRSRAGTPSTTPTGATVASGCRSSAAWDGRSTSRIRGRGS